MPAPTAPNILQITTHDSGRHFGCYGYETVHTPHVDALAADGVRLSEYFAVVPICCASRATMLTGRYPQSHGLMDLCFPPFNWALGPDERHITHILHDAGYHNVLFGVQHEVADDQIDRLAFDRIVRPDECGGRTALHWASSVGHFLSTEAADRQPFYAQIGFVETHTPFDWEGCAPDVEKGLFIPPYLYADANARSQVAGLQGSLRRADEGVGRILDALRHSGLEENTIVVFTTDHGVELPRAKWHLYDPGVAIACVLRWPGGGLTGGRTCDLLLSNVDYLPTILELADVAVPDRIEGRSSAGVLRGDTAESGRDAVFGLYHKRQARSVRTSDYKLVRYFDPHTDYYLPVRYEEMMNVRCAKNVELFDLRKDPNEFTNVIDEPEYADVRREMNSRLWGWLESADDPILQRLVPTPAWHAAHAEYQEWSKT